MSILVRWVKFLSPSQI